MKVYEKDERYYLILAGTKLIQVDMEGNSLELISESDPLFTLIKKNKLRLMPENHVFFERAFDRYKYLMEHLVIE